MSEAGSDDLASRLAALDDGETHHVCGRVLLALESDQPILTDAELEAHTAQNREVLSAVSEQLGVPRPETGTEQENAVALLLAIAEVSADHAGVIEDALRELDQRSVKLDFGTSFAIGALAVALATAIVRPRVEYRNVEETTAAGDVKRHKKLVFDARGTEHIADVVKAAVPFLSG